jgi:hypothetical protein
MRTYKWTIKYNNTTETSDGSFSKFAKRIKEIAATDCDVKIHISEIKHLKMKFIRERLT